MPEKMEQMCPCLDKFATRPMLKSTCMSSLKILMTHPPSKPSNNNAPSTRCTQSAPSHAGTIKNSITPPLSSILKATFRNSSTSYTSSILTSRGRSHTNNLKHSLREIRFVYSKLNTALWV